jgi:hypothetical protein
MDNIVHKSDDAIEHMFVDVSGQHLILTTIQGEATYINLNTFKQLKLSRVQGSIESVAFGKEIENEMENRPFLIGTTAGLCLLFIIMLSLFTKPFFLHRHDI